MIDLVYPRHCVNCKTYLNNADDLCLCDACRLEIRQNPKPFCERCGRAVEKADVLCPDCRARGPAFSRAYSAYVYDGAMKEVIHCLKYKGRISMAGPLSELLIKFINENPEVVRDIDTVTFVPLRNNRLRERGFNQSRVLASFIAGHFGIELSDLLEKTVSTRHQNELSRGERLSNLTGAFRVRKFARALEGLRVLLVDDVMTTGSTLDECAGSLTSAGAKEVRCLTLARGI